MSFVTRPGVRAFQQAAVAQGRAERFLNAHRGGGPPPAERPPSPPSSRRAEFGAADRRRPPVPPQTAAAVGSASTSIVLLALCRHPRFKGRATNLQAAERVLNSKLVDLGNLLDQPSRAVYLFIAGGADVLEHVYIARRMHHSPPGAEPSSCSSQLMRDTSTAAAMSRDMSSQVVPVIVSALLFILFSNLIGYLPLPNQHRV